MMKTIQFCLITVAMLLQPVQISAKTIEVYGHRGAAGLAPENTLAGYQTAMKLGVDVIDMDVVLTSDNQVVLYHDPVLNPAITQTRDKRWLEEQRNITSIKLGELQNNYFVGKIRPGTSLASRFPYQQSTQQQIIPTLKQIFQFVERQPGNKPRYQIELKTNPIDPRYPNYQALADQVIHLVKQFKVESRVEIQSFDFRTLRRVKRKAPELALSFVTEENDSFHSFRANERGEYLWTDGVRLADYNDNVPKMLASLGAKTWNPEYHDLTETRVKEAQKLGLRVVPWTVDTESSMREMILLQVDGIITNRPDKLLGLLAAQTYS